MKPPRPQTKCWVNGCGRPFSEHAADGTCPTRPDQKFRRHVQPSMRASMSLSAREIDALHNAMRGLVSRVGNGAKAPTEELVSVHRKLLHAKAVIEQRKGERAPTRWPLNGTGATT